MVIEEANPPSEMRKVVLASELQAAQAETQPLPLQTIHASPNGTLARVDTSIVARVEIIVETTTPKGTLVTKVNVEVALLSTPI